MISPTADRTYRILIIDDSSNIHEDFKKVLARSSGSSVACLEAELFGEPAVQDQAKIEFTVDSAFQGEDGITMLTKAQEELRPYALAFVDMRMPPGMDGLGTIVKLWTIDPHLQVVICSAYSDYSWSEIIARVGRNDRLVILRKPFDNIEVLQLAHVLTEKWNLQQRVEAQLAVLESTVAARTQDLGTSQTLFRLILENTGDLVVVVDRDGRHLYSSTSRHRLLGFSPEDAVDLSPWADVHPDDAVAVQEAANRVRATGQRETITMRWRHKGGFYLIFEASVDSVKEDAHRPVLLMITARAITESHSMEAP